MALPIEQLPAYTRSTLPDPRNAPFRDAFIVIEEPNGDRGVFANNGVSWVPLDDGNPNTPVIDDLVTGGATAAASAETVKTLKALVDSLTAQVDVLISLGSQYADSYADTYA